MNIRKIINLMVVVAFATILTSCNKGISGTAVKLKEGIYTITNPYSRSTKIINEKGEVLVKGDNLGAGNYVMTIDDRETEAPICISKMISGEKKVTNSYEYEGETHYIDSLSQRIELYDLKGKKLPFDKEGIEYIDFGLGDYVYYNNYGENKKFAYNVKTNEEKELICESFACDKGMIFLTDNAFMKKDGVTKVSIYDKNLNFIKDIKGYTYDYTAEYNGKEYIRIGTYSEIKDEYKYNYLDDDLNLLLDEPISDPRYGKIADDMTIEEYNNLEKKFNEIDNTNNYVQVKKHDGITLYLVGYGYEDKEKGEYIYGTRIYDKEFKLCDDGIDTVQQCFDEAGLILVNNDTFIDFNLNVVKKFDRKSEWQSDTKNGKVYFYDIYAKDYVNRDDGNLYDDKFNILLSDIKGININMIKDYIVIEGKDSTKLYDNDLKLCKDYERHLEIYGWGDTKSEYHSFHDKDTNLDGVMDKKWNIIIDNLKSVGYMRNDYFTFQKGFRYGLMDYKGNVLIDFSIFDSASDEDKQSPYDFY